MTPSDDHQESLQVAILDHTAYVRIMQRGSFKVSSELKQFGTAAVEHGAKDVVFDLRQCIGMDSTFMGVVAALAFKLKQENDGHVIMVGLSDRTRGLLSTLGLDQLVEPYMDGDMPDSFRPVLENPDSPLKNVEPGQANRRETTEVMYEAHSTLVQMFPQNEPRFKDVLTFLKEDLQREDDGES